MTCSHRPAAVCSGARRPACMVRLLRGLCAQRRPVGLCRSCRLGDSAAGGRLPPHKQARLCQQRRTMLCPAQCAAHAGVRHCITRAFRLPCLLPLQPACSSSCSCLCASLIRGACRPAAELPVSAPCAGTPCLLSFPLRRLCAGTLSSRMIGAARWRSSTATSRALARRSSPTQASQL